MNSAQQHFEACVPAHMQEDVMTMIAEAAQGWNEHEAVTILDRDRIDAINVRAHGIIEIGDQEYRFIVEDGNWNGTVLHDWDGDMEFEPLPRTEWVLQPSDDLVGRAIMANNGPFLIFKWDAMLKRPEIAEIPGKYAYDRMMQPGGKIEKHYRDAAAKHHFVIVSKEEADETRRRLELAK
jgi:hypothetical protein